MKKLFFLISIGPCLLALTLIYHYLNARLDPIIDSMMIGLIGMVILKKDDAKFLTGSMVVCSLIGAYFLRDNILFEASLGLSLTITRFGLMTLKEIQMLQKTTQNKADVFEKLLEKSLQKQEKLQEQLDALYVENFFEQDIEAIELDAYCRKTEDAIFFENHLEQLEKEVQKKEQKRPLRRLQKMVMKQTSFFDEA